MRTNNAAAVATPMLDNMLAVKDQSQAIGEFLEWLVSERGLTLCETHAPPGACYENGRRRAPTCEIGDERFYPASPGIEQLLAEYFKIDLAKCEQERRALLVGVRVDHRLREAGPPKVLRTDRRRRA